MTLKAADAGEPNILWWSFAGRGLSALIVYNLLALVVVLPQRTRSLAGLKGGELFYLLVLLPEVLQDCEASGLVPFKGGGQALETVVALGWGSHPPRYTSNNRHLRELIGG